MDRMCLLTEQEVKRDGEEESKIQNVTDWKNEYIFKTEQPGVGMVFKWTVVSSILDLGERTDMHMESCIRQMEKNSPSTDCLQGWG